MSVCVRVAALARWTAAAKKPVASGCQTGQQAKRPLTGWALPTVRTSSRSTSKNQELVDSMVWLAEMRPKAILQLSREAALAAARRAQRPHILYAQHFITLL
eukprot:COSAG01_NODE_2968_length_6788_cov_4.595904_3_plen_102_part_00